MIEEGLIEVMSASGEHSQRKDKPNQEVGDQAQNQNDRYANDNEEQKEAHMLQP